MLTSFGRAVLITIIAMCMVIIIISTKLDQQRHNDILELAEINRKTDLEIIKYNEEVLEYNTDIARRNAELYLKKTLQR